MQMLKKLFNVNSKYYLELDEVKDSAVVQTTVETAQKTTEAVQEVADVTKSEAVQEVVKTAQDTVMPEPSSTAATGAKSGKKISQANPKNSAASSFEPPFWVAAMNNTNNSTTNSNSNGRVAEQIFASDNLMPTVTTYRRRPGSSLAKFKDMAKSARTPRK